MTQYGGSAGPLNPHIPKRGEFTSGIGSQQSSEACCCACLSHNTTHSLHSSIQLFFGSVPPDVLKR